MMSFRNERSDELIEEAVKLLTRATDGLAGNSNRVQSLQSAIRSALDAKQWGTVPAAWNIDQVSV